MSALTRLAEKVEAGTATPDDFVENGLMENISAPKSAWKAYNGSLNAAKALHEAVLPGWMLPCWVSHFTNGKHGVTVEIYPLDPANSSEAIAEHTDPARAWLLAILRALASTEPD